MKILITGANGFLGSHLVKAILKAGYEVFGLEHSSSNLERIKADLPSKNIEFSDEVDFSNYFRRHEFDGIIHTAVNYGRGESCYNDIIKLNILFPVEILQLCDQGLKFFINCSTILSPGANIYALSKQQFRQWAEIISKERGIDFWNLELDQFFGPGEASNQFPSMIVKACLQNESIPLSGGEQLRGFTYIDDVVSAFLTILNHLERRQSTGFQTVGIGTGNPVKLRSFVEIVKRLTCSESELQFGKIPYRDGELDLTGPDISFLRSLDWNSKVDLESGVRKLVDSLRDS